MLDSLEGEVLDLVLSGRICLTFGLDRVLELTEMEKSVWRLFEKSICDTTMFRRICLRMVEHWKPHSGSACRSQQLLCMLSALASHPFRMPTLRAFHFCSERHSLGCQVGASSCISQQHPEWSRHLMELLMSHHSKVRYRRMAVVTCFKSWIVHVGIFNIPISIWLVLVVIYVG